MDSPEAPRPDAPRPDAPAEAARPDGGEPGRTGDLGAAAPPPPDAAAEPPLPVEMPPEPAAGEEAPPPHRRRRGRIVLALLVGLAAWAGYEVLTWPRVAALADANPDTTAFIEHYRENHGPGTPLAWRWVPYGHISADLKHAVVVAEDIDFFTHHGFAWAELKTALAEAREEGELPRGASTITQQLAKNLWLSPSRNPWRKVKEALLTAQLERDLPKRRILELYLNVVEFGPGVYGAEAAARRYFGKPAADLTLEEAAALASGLPRPSTWHPGSTSRAYQRRVKRIAARVAKTAWVRREL
jgi:monofunctional glycosyltransferase